MAFGALFSKTWRVHKIFTAQRAIKRKVRNVAFTPSFLHFSFSPRRPRSPRRLIMCIVLINSYGTLVAYWSVRSSFTSEVAGSILSENFLNVTRTQCSTHVKESVNTLPKVVGFLRALRFPPTGKLTGWVRINTDREVKSQLL